MLVWFVAACGGPCHHGAATCPLHSWHTSRAWLHRDFADVASARAPINLAGLLTGSIALSSASTLTHCARAGALLNSSNPHHSRLMALLGAAELKSLSEAKKQSGLVS